MRPLAGATGKSARMPEGRGHPAALGGAGMGRRHRRGGTCRAGPGLGRNAKGRPHSSTRSKRTASETRRGRRWSGVSEGGSGRQPHDVRPRRHGGSGDVHDAEIHASGAQFVQGAHQGFSGGEARPGLGSPSWPSVRRFHQPRRVPWGSRSRKTTRWPGRRRSHAELPGNGGGANAALLLRDHHRPHEPASITWQGSPRY